MADREGLFRWVVVVAPRGDVVRLDNRYSECHDASSLFGMSCDGVADDGGPVTVRGSHIAMAWKERPATWAADRGVRNG